LFKGFGSRNKESVAQLFVSLISKVSYFKVQLMFCGPSFFFIFVYVRTYLMIFGTFNQFFKPICLVYYPKVILEHRSRSISENFYNLPVISCCFLHLGF
jgi:hypothetical protein